MNRSCIAALALIALTGCLKSPVQQYGQVSGSQVSGSQVSGSQVSGTAEVHHIGNDEISESSGLVRSRTHDGIFWTHNDSGDTPRIFAIDRTGETVGEFSVAGARHVDWEDIAIDDSGHLFLGDIGNNSSKRRDLTVYRIVEPDPSSGPAKVLGEHVLRYRYEDQTIGTSPRNFDSESLIWLSGSLYIFTKHRADTRTQVYRLLDEPGAGEQVLEPLGAIELGGEIDVVYGNASAADVTFEGRYVALLTYTSIHLFERTGSDLLPLERVGRTRLDRGRTRQAESIAWDGDALLFGNEQGDLFRIPDPFSPTATDYPPE